MSDTSRLRHPSTSAPAVPLSRAVRAAVVSALATWLPLAVLVVAGWAGSPRSTVGWSTTLGATSLAWVAAHLGSLREGSATLSLSPLLLTLLPLLACAAAGRALAEPIEEDRTPRVQLLGGMRGGVARLLAAFLGSYLAAGLLVALLGSTLPVDPHWPSTVLGLVLVPLVGLLVGLRQVWSRPTFAPSWHDTVATLLPAPVRRAAGAGLRGTGLLLVAGLLPVVVTVLAHLGRVRDLTGALQAGPLGNAVLAVVQLAWLPDLAAWGLSWLAGPGFSVGLGSSYSWGEARSGLLPMVPVLGALPDDGALPWWTVLAGLVPVAVGALVARRALRTLPALATLRSKALAAGAACLVALLGTVVVMLLASGSLGSRALASVGPHLWATTGALAAELALGAALVLALTWHRYHR